MMRALTTINFKEDIAEAENDRKPGNKYEYGIN